MSTHGKLAWLGCVALLLSACGPQDRDTEKKAETADEFVARVNRELTELGAETQVASFTQATYITPDTEMLSAKANDRYLAYVSQAAEQAERYEGEKLSPATARSIALLKISVSAPAPRDPAKRAQLTKLGSRLEAMYGE